MTFLTWYNIIFYIPLFVGILMILGVVLGIAELPHGFEVDANEGSGLDGGPEADGEAGADHDSGDASHGAQAPGMGHGVLVLLGFGRAPVLVLFMSMTLIFGGTGTFANLALERWLRSSEAFVLVSLAAASSTTVVLTGIIARVVNRFLPTLETTSVTKHDLVGCIGSLVLPSNEHEGLVQVTKHGDVYQVRCRSVESLERGTSVLVTAYDRDQNLYFVSRNPLN